MASCKSCGAPILWAHTGLEKKMPVDEEAHEDGNLVLDRIMNGQFVVRPVMPLLDDRETPRYRSHFVTCPNAAGHRAVPRKSKRRQADGG